jgi:hypothetical protein
MLAIAALAAACTAGGAFQPAGSAVGPSEPGASASASTWAEETPPPSLDGASGAPVPKLVPSLEDRTGLVTGIEPADPADPFKEGLAAAASGGHALLVSWFAPPCEVRPTLRVEGSADDLSVTIYRGPVLEGECPASLAHRTLRVSFAAPVDPAGATLLVQEGELPS